MLYPELSLRRIRVACLLFSIGIAGAQYPPGGGYPGGGSPYPGRSPYPGGSPYPVVEAAPPCRSPDARGQSKPPKPIRPNLCPISGAS